MAGALGHLIRAIGRPYHHLRRRRNGLDERHRACPIPVHRREDQHMRNMSPVPPENLIVLADPDPLQLPLYPALDQARPNRSASVRRLPRVPRRLRPEPEIGRDWRLELQAPEERPRDLGGHRHAEPRPRLPRGRREETTLDRDDDDARRLEVPGDEGVHTEEHQHVERQRRELLQQLTGVGVAQDKLVEELPKRLAGHVTITVGPTGAQVGRPQNGTTPA